VSSASGERRPGPPGVSSASGSARLAELSVADPAQRWAALGFAVQKDSVWLDGVRIALGAPGRGITRWSLSGIGSLSDIDGLATSVIAEAGAVAGPSHPNGALALDHVVVTTPDFDRTGAALEAAGLPFRRVRNVEPGGFRQGFRRLGPAILEVVEARHAPSGPATFWGLVVIVSDLAGLAARLGEHLAPARPAVQRGRQIAPLRASAGLGPAVAFMDPEPVATPR
jgi:hypothetical protein